MNNHPVTRYVREINAGSTCCWITPRIEDFLIYLYDNIKLYHEADPIPANPKSPDLLNEYDNEVMNIIYSWSTEGAVHTIEQIPSDSQILGLPSPGQLVALFNEVLNLTAA